MAFDFGQYSRKEYKNTFLQNVLFTIHFDEIASSLINDEVMTKWKDYVCVNFNNIDIPPALLHKPISISRKDGALTYIFINGEVGVAVGAKGYRTFVDNVIPQIFKLIKFLNCVLSITCVKSVSVRKINIWQFNTQEKGDVKQDDIIANIFSEKFISAKTNGLFDEEEKKIQYLKKYEWIDGDKKAIARTVFMPRRQDGTFAQVLDTELILQQQELIPTESLMDISIQLNDDLYNLYHWCVNDRIIELMLGEDCKNG